MVVCARLLEETPTYLVQASKRASSVDYRLWLFGHARLVSPPIPRRGVSHQQVVARADVGWWWAIAGSPVGQKRGCGYKGCAGSIAGVYAGRRGFNNNNNAST